MEVAADMVMAVAVAIPVVIIAAATDGIAPTTVAAYGAVATAEHHGILEDK